MQTKRALQDQLSFNGIARSLKRRVLWFWCFVISATVLVSCQKQAVAPIALAPEDMCTYCKMAISEKRYAAELIDDDGQAFKFDDIGCMSNFVTGQKAEMKIAAYFVIDFESRQWTKADDAFYVHSPELKTPMSGGIIAFKNEVQAKEAAAKYHGKLLRFEDLLRLKGREVSARPVRPALQTGTPNAEL